MNALLLAVAVALECGNPGSWQLSQRTESPETGVEVVTITLRTDDGRPASPPEFRAAWTVPLVDIAHLWTPERGCVSVVSGSAVSKFCANTPVYAFFSESCENRFAFACSEASRAVRMDWRAVFETVGAFDASVSLDFFSEAEAPLAAYEVRLRFDTRRIRWDEAVQGSAAWVAGDARGGPTPDAAYDPVYSTWYAFERAFDAATLERECALAAQMGMRTLITDDGWQRTHGDWLPVPEKFPDFRAHVAKVKSLGMRYLLWYALPFMNEKSANYRRFEGKYLKAGPFWEHRLGMLDPRFPEVRKQIVDDLERLMRDYDLDGFKLDFLDSFRFYGEDPARAENFAGRDTKSVPEAAERLMREVRERLTILKPDVLIEFRQTYVGPVACRYGNMLRANDCPGDPSVNRARTTNVRLTAGGRAVHSDMLKWSPADAPESAARSILSVLFTAIQYSMVLDSLPSAHRAMVAKWLKFAEAHKETLQKGGFRAYAPQAGYPLLEGWSEKERIFAVYDANFVVPLGRADRRTILVNATSSDRVLVADEAGVRSVKVPPSDFTAVGGGSGVEGYLYAVDNAVRATTNAVLACPPADARYRDAALPVEERIDDLLKYLTPEEKMDLLHSPGGMSLGDNPRIGLSGFRTPDGPNGPRTERPVTYFPSPIAYAATFDRALVREIGRVHGEETRGAYPSPDSPARMLLGPGVNLARTPLGGRNFEYFGEDPYLSGVCAGAYCLGLQSCRVAPSVKHYVLNEQEWCRTVIDVECPERALHELYMRPFGIAIAMADCWSVMNSLNGESGRFMSHNLRLNAMLSDEYGFTGAVLSDWGGMRGTVAGFNGGTTIETSVQRDPARDKAEALQLKRGELDPVRVDDALRRNLRLFFRVGAFDTETASDKSEQAAYEKSFGGEGHFAVARRTAEESFVLLENREAFLPLDRSKVKTVALVGPGADMHYSMIDGVPVHLAGGAAAINPIAEPTPLEVFVKAFGKENVFFSPGMRYANANRCTVDGVVEWPVEVAARRADVVVYCGGTDHTYDKEGAFPGNSGPCDKPDLGLTGPQAALIEQIAKVNPNVVVALTIGAPVSVEPWDGLVRSILVTWYSGQFGAETLYRTLFGEVNPSGRLPYTFGRKLEDWPAHALGEVSYPGVYTNTVPELFRKQDKLYAYQRYLDGIWVGYRGFDRFGTAPKYPFGYGLSYTTYALRKGTADFRTRTFTAEAANVGARAGRCVVQCYVSKRATGVEMPVRELAGFESVWLEPGGRQTVRFDLKEEVLRYWDERTHGWKLPEDYEVRLGFSSADLPVVYRPNAPEDRPHGPLQVVLTFDDALKDHLLLAAPMLEARGWRGTFSIVTDWVGKNGRHLAWDDVRELVRRGHEIATHTKSHAFLVTALDEGRTNDMVRELTFSRDEIARQTGILPRILCPPFIQQNAETARLAREAGLVQMDIPRVIFGSNNVNGVTAVLEDAIAQGQRRIDILHHGVSAEDHGGWCAFPTRASFEAHLDAIKRLEDAGKIVVTDYPLPGD